MQGKLLYVGIISFTLGIGIRSLISINYFVIAFLILLTGVFFVYGIFLKISSSTQFFKIVLFGSFIISFFALGIIHYQISDLKRGDSALDIRIGEAITLEGFVVSEPDERENNVRLTIQFEKLYGDKVVEVQGKGIITTDFYPAFSYGDRLKLTGTLKKPENFENDLGREFNYVEFLAKDGIFYQMFRPKIELIESEQGGFIKRNIFAFKGAFLNKIKKVVPEPASSLSGGLLLGTKQSLGSETLDDFRRVGLIHIVVLSGYNITIVAESFVKTLGFFLSKQLAGVFGIMGIIIFAIMTGAGATVVRASLMVVLVLIARMLGRDYSANRALFLAGLVMLIHNPKILLFDPSFQLSFVAMLGLVNFSPIILRYVQFLPERFGIRELTSSTLATQIFVLPLILYMMGELSLVALPVNLLVLAFIPLTMFVSFVTGSLGFVFQTLSIPFGFISFLFLSYIFKIVEFFASLPFASIKISHFPLWLMVLIYVVYGYLFWKWGKKRADN